MSPYRTSRWMVYTQIPNSLLSKPSRHMFWHFRVCFLFFASVWLRTLLLRWARPAVSVMTGAGHSGYQKGRPLRSRPSRVFRPRRGGLSGHLGCSPFLSRLGQAVRRSPRVTFPVSQWCRNFLSRTGRAVPWIPGRPRRPSMISDRGRPFRPHRGRAVPAIAVDPG